VLGLFARQLFGIDGGIQFKRGAVRIALIAATAMVASLTASPPVEAAKRAAERPSPGGQLMVVSVNAKQGKVLDVQRFKRLHSLTLALLDRPAAFDAGAKEVITAPDIIMLQEMTFSNVEILHRLLNQRSKFNYLFVATPNSKTKMLVNSDTITMVGEPEEWSDPCLPERRYLLGRFTENSTGAPFVAVNMHLHRNYEGDSKCRMRNIEALHAEVADETGGIVVGGDFNQRPTAQFRECDLNEDTEPAPWWARMIAPMSTGVEFVDSVRDSSRNAGRAMENEWTHAQKSAKQTCSGEFSFRRSRIDYIFVANAGIADAHADDPGWTVYDPKIHDLNYFQYSDHRWVWARLSLVGPPRVAPVTIEPAADGLLTVTWEAVEGAAGYIVYRAKPDAQYAVQEVVGPEVLSYEDESTAHDKTYRYSVAAVGADDAQGIESPGVTATADAKGPDVRWINPPKGARFVSRKMSVTVGFDERVEKSSIADGLISLRLNGRKVAGSFQQVNRRTFTFDPRSRLKKNKTYRVFVRSVADKLGNNGSSFSSSFST
jgi:endonuclease/exonuclease/phosphatase family metal-dependent hydrolase